ncbi:MAG: signal recognition particle-docking protein FtsY [Spirochaetia bacterium]|nr:signal recognition particle-docking protein FtsY [Spirochaetia bacterium]MBQ3647413.1 signal recognition particle-docking protein FtsY [Spirochaetia bacterium]MBQ3713887.1 signal recognition particle-docking protein FtsY [Spirochaetia bacterium]MBR0319012.1 signal recognition particle-docking protein FtsY [Spirochaetia bacterium]
MRSLGNLLKSIFKTRTIDESAFEDIEDALIEGDVGASAAVAIVDELRTVAKKERITDFASLKEALYKILDDRIKEYDFKLNDGVNLFLFLGVNGVGKTTSIAKLGKYLQTHTDKKVVFAAGDTFRAAAIEQIELHGQRLGIRVVSQQNGSDPGAVIFDAIDSVKAKGEDVILADTAGRMHNKSNLIKELQKIDKIILNKLPKENYKKFIVIDATTGQNGLSQVEIFNEALSLDGIVLSKYDSAAKGGILLSISGKLGIPVAFVGTGEKYGDFAPFDKKAFLEGLLATD